MSTNQMPQDEGMQKTNTQVQRDAGIWWAGLIEGETRRNSSTWKASVSSQVEQGVGLLHTAEFRRHVDRGSVGKPPSGHQIQEEKGKVDIFCTTISVHTSTPEQEPAFPAVPLSLVPCSCRQHTLTQDFTNRGLPLLPTAYV